MKTSSYSWHCSCSSSLCQSSCSCLGWSCSLAIHAINRIPSPVIRNQTPYKHLFGSPLDYHTFAPSVLLVSFFFSHVSITNLSLGQGFVVFLAMAKLKKGIGVIILFFIIFVSPAMFFFLGTSPLCWAFSLSCLLIFLFCLRSFSRWGTYSFYNCSWSSCSCS